MGHAETKRERIESAILMLLRAGEEGYSIFDIAEELDCDPSTVHRYLQEIRITEPLEEVRRGRYRIDSRYILSNVRLTPAEATVIYLALRKFVRQTGQATKFMISALQKVIMALRHDELISLMQVSMRSLEAERPASPEFTRIWEILLEGWREQWLVQIEYLRAGAEQPEWHEIEPYLFEPQVFGDGLYVIAWSRTRQGLRTFKPDRIRQASLLPRHFEKRVDLTVDTLLKHSWGIWYGETPITVELLFMPGLPASRVQETTYLPTETKQLLEDGSLHWSAEVVGWIEILSWIRGWGAGVKVLAPDNLRDRIRDDLEKALRLYAE